MYNCNWPTVYVDSPRDCNRGRGSENLLSIHCCYLEGICPGNKPMIEKSKVYHRYYWLRKKNSLPNLRIHIKDVLTKILLYHSLYTLCDITNNSL